MVRTIGQTYMDSQLATIDQFTSMIVSIQESMARLGQRIEEQQAPHDQVQDEARNDPTAPTPPHSIKCRDDPTTDYSAYYIY